MSDIGIIGGADGPTAVFVSSTSPLTTILWAVIAVVIAALLVFALVKLIKTFRADGISRDVKLICLCALVIALVAIILLIVQPLIVMLLL